MDDSSGCGCLMTVLWLPGMILATIISWEMHHSIFLAIVHCWLSWLYIGYLFFAQLL